MRLIRIALLIALAGCPGDPDEPTFTIAEPARGATLDRCNIRVRTTPPIPMATWGPGGGGPLDTGDHVNWRVDGGREIEVAPMSVNRPTEKTNFVFGATLAADSSMLEIGTCDEFDICTYQQVPVVIANPAGAPDCSAMHGGQLHLDGEEITYDVTPLPDGRLVLPTANDDFGLLMLKPDGTRDTTFGGGRVVVPLFPDHVAQLGDGSFLVLGAGFYLAHVSSAGVLDVAFGNAENTPGVRVMPCPQGTGCVASVMRSDGAGGVLLAGTSSAGSYIMRLDATFAVTESVVVDAVARPAVAMEPDGRTLFAGDTGAAVGTLSGIDTSFGTAGTVTYPSSATGIAGDPMHGALSGSHVVLARPRYDGNTRIVEIRTFDGTVAHAPMSLPIVTDPMSFAYSGGAAFAAVDASGRAYVTVARERSRVTDSWYSMAAGSEILVARIVDGALDPAFGKQGLAGYDTRDLWSPVATEDMYELPRAIVMTDAGPWIVSTAQSFGQYTDPNILRGPGAMLTRIKP